MTATPAKKQAQQKTRVRTPPRSRKPKPFKTHNYPGPFATISFHDESLKQLITTLVANNYGYYSSAKYKGEFPLQLMSSMRDTIASHTRNYAPGKELLETLNTFTAELERYATDALETGEVEFYGLAAFFKPGAEVITHVEDQLVGGIIDKAHLKVTWMGIEYYEITIKVFHNLSGSVQEQLLPVRVGEYHGKVKIGQLPLRPIDDEARGILTERGKKFIRYARSASYVSYTGQLIKNDWWSAKAYRADGRAMLDPATLSRIDNNQFSNEERAAGFIDTDEEQPQIRGSKGGAAEEELIVPEGQEWRCYPFVYGFSFAAKQWGRMVLDGVRDIEWREDAFEKLVLADEDKELIRALVEHQGGTFQDLVEGKGGGVIFLLHGPPGEGKTLTAEAVAELLHKPLYSISVGELGTHPDQLEARLRTVLDIATVWDAVVLMDEADIFLEARDEHDIVRNAMVGVFLRLLEYHQGVMFLTTNRVRNIDSAFYSRISIALHFTKGDQAKRKKIWDNLLKAARIEGLDTARLSDFTLNGRQIKSIIRLSQTLAKARSVPISADVVAQVVDRVTRFENDLAEIKRQ